jgi:sugar phosphate isomerase/epimerase
MAAPRVRIGNQTSVHAAAVRLPYDFALAAGFDAFEWFSDKGRQSWSEDDVDADARKRLRDQGRERDLLFSVHVPFAANPVDAAGADAIRRSLDFAADVAADVVNVHLFTDRGPRAFADALWPLLRQARAAGLRISLENTPGTSPEDFNAVFAVLQGQPEAAVAGMCLDMGHANLCPATRNDYLGYVDRLGAHVPIIHWHAHENWGDRDSHLALFTGPSAQDDRGVRGLVQRLRRRGFQGSVVLEQWPDPPELLVQARDRLRQLFEAAEYVEATP